MEEQKNNGLQRAFDIYRHRGRRARQLKEEGKRIFGYFCCYPPIELLTALNITAVRVLGNMDEPVTEADDYLPPVMCIFCRSAFDLGMKAQYNYFDGFVGAHACDGAERTSFIWQNYIHSPCNFQLDVPHTSHGPALTFFKEQIAMFQQTLEEFSGTRIRPDDLKHAIALHNRQRALVRELYGMRKPNPPLISGTEMLQVLIAVMSIPVTEGNDLLNSVIDEVTTRVNPHEAKRRLLIWGSLIDHSAFTDLIESSGFNIVLEDTAIGTRPFWHDIEVTADPLDGISDHYLNEVLCPRTFRETGPTYHADAERRFNYLKEFAKHWNVDGVFANIIRNCDIHGYEVPVIKDYFGEMGLPVLVIEQDYSTAALETLRTRFEAFAENIDGY
jgi:benzoyl-CoA reductase subunit C